ncbi:MAG: FixH family protein [Pseudomonadota bacterium]
MKRITGWHVFGLFASGFAIIIAVNLTLAWNAVHTFPGLEVKNTYVASQSFDRSRAAQEALEWDVSASLRDGHLYLTFAKQNQPVIAQIESAVFGRATSVANDQTPAFSFDGTAFVAPVEAGTGNWNLRIVARAADGTTFQQRIVVRAGS